MSGQLLVQPTGLPDERHLRVRMLLDDGGELRLVDQRMFGGLSVSAGGADLPSEIAHIARDPLDPQFDDDGLVRRGRRRGSGLKPVLLDHTGRSGSGDISSGGALWWG